MATGLAIEQTGCDRLVSGFGRVVREADREIVKQYVGKRELVGGPKTREIMCTPFVKEKKNDES